MAAQTPRKQLIILGAGFAGLTLAKALRDVPLDILGVDRQNYHLFQPLLYQVATTALSPADIAYPIRRVFRSQLTVTVARLLHVLHPHQVGKTVWVEVVKRNKAAMQFWQRGGFVVRAQTERAGEAGRGPSRKERASGNASRLTSASFPAILTGHHAFTLFMSDNPYLW